MQSLRTCDLPQTKQDMCWITTSALGPFLIIKLKCFHLSVFVLHVLYFYHKHKRPITRYLSWSRQTWPRRDSQRSRGRLTEALGCVWGQADSRLPRVSDVGTRPHPAHDWQQGKQQKHYSRACWRDDGLHDRTSNLPPFDFSASFSWWFVVIVIIIVSIGCFIPRSVPSVIPGSSQLEACVRTCKTLRVY